MKNENINSADFALLRQKAEEKLKKKHAFKLAQLTEADTVKLVHELEIHQIELELQNEELRLVRDKAKTATEKYTALYDFAYTGYFTLNSKGKIFWLNLSGAKMLGRDRSNLVNRYFQKYITLDTLADFNDFFLKIFQDNSKVSCEVRIINAGNPSIFVLIEGVLSENEHKCLITMVDITKRKRAEEILQYKAHELEQFNDLMEISDVQMNELKKEINFLLIKMGEKEKFLIAG
jgi:PAS domain S-box-containing protein